MSSALAQPQVSHRTHSRHTAGVERHPPPPPPPPPPLHAPHVPDALSHGMTLGVTATDDEAEMWRSQPSSSPSPVPAPDRMDDQRHDGPQQQLPAHAQPSSNRTSPPPRPLTSSTFHATPITHSETPTPTPQASPAPDPTVASNRPSDNKGRSDARLEDVRLTTVPGLPCAVPIQSGGDDGDYRDMDRIGTPSSSKPSAHRAALGHSGAYHDDGDGGCDYDDDYCCGNGCCCGACAEGGTGCGSSHLARASFKSAASLPAWLCLLLIGVLTAVFFFLPWSANPIHIVFVVLSFVIGAAGALAYAQLEAATQRRLARDAERALQKRLAWLMEDDGTTANVQVREAATAAPSRTYSFEEGEERLPAAVASVAADDKTPRDTCCLRQAYHREVIPGGVLLLLGALVVVSPQVMAVTTTRRALVASGLDTIVFTDETHYGLATSFPAEVPFKVALLHVWFLFALRLPLLVDFIIGVLHMAALVAQIASPHGAVRAGPLLIMALWLVVPVVGFVSLLLLYTTASWQAPRDGDLDHPGLAPPPPRRTEVCPAPLWPAGQPIDVSAAAAHYYTAAAAEPPPPPVPLTSAWATPSSSSPVAVSDHDGSPSREGLAAGGVEYRHKVRQQLPVVRRRGGTGGGEARGNNVSAAFSGSFSAASYDPRVSMASSTLAAPTAFSSSGFGNHPRRVLAHRAAATSTTAAAPPTLATKSREQRSAAADAVAQPAAALTARPPQSPPSPSAGEQANDGHTTTRPPAEPHTEAKPATAVAGVAAAAAVGPAAQPPAPSPPPVSVSPFADTEELCSPFLVLTTDLVIVEASPTLASLLGAPAQHLRRRRLQDSLKWLKVADATATIASLQALCASSSAAAHSWRSTGATGLPSATRGGEAKADRFQRHKSKSTPQKHVRWAAKASARAGDGKLVSGTADEDGTTASPEDVHVEQTAVGSPVRRLCWRGQRPTAQGATRDFCLTLDAWIAPVASLALSVTAVASAAALSSSPFLVMLRRPLLHGVLDALSLPVALVHPRSGVVQYWSPAAALVTNRSATEMVGFPSYQSWVPMLLGSDAEEQAAAAALTGEDEAVVLNKVPSTTVDAVKGKVPQADQPEEDDDVMLETPPRSVAGVPRQPATSSAVPSGSSPGSPCPPLSSSLAASLGSSSRGPEGRQGSTPTARSTLNALNGCRGLLRLPPLGEGSSLVTPYTSHIADPAHATAEESRQFYLSCLRPLQGWLHAEECGALDDKDYEKALISPWTARSAAVSASSGHWPTAADLLTSQRAGADGGGERQGGHYTRTAAVRTLCRLAKDVAPLLLLLEQPYQSMESASFFDDTAPLLRAAPAAAAATAAAAGPEQPTAPHHPSSAASLAASASVVSASGEATQGGAGLLAGFDGSCSFPPRRGPGSPRGPASPTLPRLPSLWGQGSTTLRFVAAVKDAIHAYEFGVSSEESSGMQQQPQRQTPRSLALPGTELSPNSSSLSPAAAVAARQNLLDAVRDAERRAGYRTNTGGGAGCGGALSSPPTCTVRLSSRELGEVKRAETLAETLVQLLNAFEDEPKRAASPPPLLTRGTQQAPNAPRGPKTGAAGIGQQGPRDGVPQTGSSGRASPGEALSSLPQVPPPPPPPPPEHEGGVDGSGDAGTPPEVATQTRASPPPLPDASQGPQPEVPSRDQTGIYREPAAQPASAGSPVTPAPLAEELPNESASAGTPTRSAGASQGPLAPPPPPPPPRQTTSGATLAGGPHRYPMVSVYPPPGRDEEPGEAGGVDGDDMVGEPPNDSGRDVAVEPQAPSLASDVHASQPMHTSAAAFPPSPGVTETSLEPLAAEASVARGSVTSPNLVTPTSRSRASPSLSGPSVNPESHHHQQPQPPSRGAPPSLSQSMLPNPSTADAAADGVVGDGRRPSMNSVRSGSHPNYPASSDLPSTSQDVPSVAGLNSPSHPAPGRSHASLHHHQNLHHNTSGGGVPTAVEESVGGSRSRIPSMSTHTPLQKPIEGLWAMLVSRDESSVPSCRIRVPLDVPFRFGRSSKCTVVVADTFVSSVHFSITRTIAPSSRTDTNVTDVTSANRHGHHANNGAGGPGSPGPTSVSPPPNYIVTLTDLSANGTLVNAKRVGKGKSCVLHDNALITFRLSTSQFFLGFVFTLTDEYGQPLRQHRPSARPSSSLMGSSSSQRASPAGPGNVVNSLAASRRGATPRPLQSTPDNSSFASGARTPNGSRKGGRGSQSNFASGSRHRARETIEWKIGEEMLGKGGNAEVFLGINLTNGQLIAVKRVPLPITVQGRDDPEAKALLQQYRSLQEEINVLSKAVHPNIVRYYGSSQNQTYFNILLEFVPGGSLRHLLDNFGALSPGVIYAYLRQALEGLAYLHQLNIVHSDIKCANILITERGRAKLTDFGTARLLNRPHAAVANATTPAEAGQAGQAGRPRSGEDGGALGQNTTSTGGTLHVAGTLRWMDPALFRSGRDDGASAGPTKASDIWSVGCAMIEMMSGEAPWYEYDFESEEQIINLLKYTEEPPEVPECPECPELVDICAHCLQLEPAARPTCEELLRLVEEASDRLQAQAMSVSPSREPSPGAGGLVDLARTGSGDLPSTGRAGGESVRSLPLLPSGAGSVTAPPAVNADHAVHGGE